MPIAITVPQMGESVVEGTIGKWHKQIGEKVARDDILVEILTDKVTVEVPSAYAGTLGKIMVSEGDVVQVGQQMAILLKEGEDPTHVDDEEVITLDGLDDHPSPHAPRPAEAPVAAVSAGGNGDPQPPRVRTSPAVRRLAHEQGIDLSLVPATGPRGRIRKADLEAFMQGGVPQATPAPAQMPPQVAPARSIPIATPNAGEHVQTIPLEGVRKLIADHMVMSKRTSPHVMVMDEVDMTSLVEFRSKHKERIQHDYGVKLTYMPFFVKAVTAALKNHPKVNASITDTEIILRKYYHIGIAVARDEGLIVPVVKHADTKGVLQLASEIQDLAERSRRDALSPDDIAGGTFTLTNAGMFGALASTPVINQPQVAILGIHAIQKRPVVRNDQIVARDMMYLTLSFDHRLIDGHTAVQFLREVCDNLGEPANMLLG